MNDYDQPPTPVCYGDLDVVFPEHDDGLRHIPDSCRDCGLDQECLKLALKNPKGQEFLADRQAASRGGDQPASTVDKARGFLKRWSDRKIEHDTRRKKK